MKALLKKAAIVLSLLIAAAWISGCVIHAHHGDGSDKSKPAKTHKSKPSKTHKAKPPGENKPAKKEDKAPKSTGHNPPPPPPPSNAP